MNDSISSSTFSSLNLPPYILKALEQSGYQNPTWVQNDAIPLVRDGVDLLVEAQTGTGKTASFALPIIMGLNEKPPKNKSVHTLVLAPTRELAVQVEQFFKRYAMYSPVPIRTLSIIGGVERFDQVVGAFNGASVVVATPGRLGELLRNGEINLNDVEVLVVDEADKLLNLGFAEELGVIMQELPVKRQTLLFSATFSKKVNELADKILTNPTRLKMIDHAPTVANIHQRIIEVNQDKRRGLLEHLIETEKWEHVLVFVASRRGAANLTRKLQKNGIRTAAFHGDMNQEERTNALDMFRKRKVGVLVATDIAARGIDFLKISHVVNFDLPRSPSDYIHRIGRTGRAGEKGTSVSFVNYENESHFLLIEKRAEIKLQREQVPNFELVGEGRVSQKGKAPVKGKRKSKKDKIREAEALDK